MTKIYPIIISTFDRLDKIKALIDSLNNNLLSTESDLFIFSDQGKNFFSKFKVYLVRRYLKKISGFKSINIINRKYNDLLVKQQQNPDILIKVLERFSSPEKNQEIRKPEDSPRK
jgi:hypothetical protein